MKPQDFPVHNRLEVALAGRSNVGKSSLVNALVPLKRLAHVSKQPGRTQTINFFALDERLCLVDLPGYGYAKVPKKLKESWGPMIEGYLRGREQLRLLIALMDARHGPTNDDLTLWEWARGEGPELLCVATKWDKVKKSERTRRLRAMTESLDAEPIPFSAMTGEGRDRLEEAIRSLART